MVDNNSEESQKENNIILKKTLGHHSFEFKDGMLMCWNMANVLEPLSYMVVKDFCTFAHFGKKAIDLQYYLLKSRAKIGMEFLHKQWGYKDVKKVVEYQLQTAGLMGRGILKLSRFDTNLKNAIIKTSKNPFAQMYKNFFSVQKQPIDHYLRGGMAGIFSYAFGCDMVAIETQCEAMGKPMCIIEVKEKDKWDLNDPLVKEQFPGDESEFKEDIEKLTVTSMQKH